MSRRQDERCMVFLNLSVPEGSIGNDELELIEAHLGEILLQVIRETERE